MTSSSRSCPPVTRSYRSWIPPAWNRTDPAASAMQYRLRVRSSSHGRNAAPAIVSAEFGAQASAPSHDYPTLPRPTATPRRRATHVAVITSSCVGARPVTRPFLLFKSGGGRRGSVSGMASLADVERMVGALPGTVETTRHGTRTWAVGGAQRYASGAGRSARRNFKRFGDEIPPDEPILAIGWRTSRRRKRCWPRGRLMGSSRSRISTTMRPTGRVGEGLGVGLGRGAARSVVGVCAGGRGEGASGRQGDVADGCACEEAGAAGRW